MALISISSPSTSLSATPSVMAFPVAVVVAEFSVTAAVSTVATGASFLPSIVTVNAAVSVLVPSLNV